MRRDDLYHASGARDAMKLRHDGERIANMLDHVSANNLVEPVIREWIGPMIQVINHISRGPRVDIHTDGAGRLAFPATSPKPHLNVTPMRKPMRCPWPHSTSSRISKRRATLVFTHRLSP